MANVHNVETCFKMVQVSLTTQVPIRGLHMDFWDLEFYVK